MFRKICLVSCLAVAASAEADAFDDLLLGLSRDDAIEMECRISWFRRNAIFNDAGQCFSSELGGAVFDNADCRGEARLNEDQVAEVGRYARLEQSLLCADFKPDWQASDFIIIRQAAASQVAPNPVLADDADTELQRPKPTQLFCEDAFVWTILELPDREMPTLEECSPVLRAAYNTDLPDYARPAYERAARSFGFSLVETDHVEVAQEAVEDESALAMANEGACLDYIRYGIDGVSVSACEPIVQRIYDETSDEELRAVIAANAGQYGLNISLHATQHAQPLRPQQASSNPWSIDVEEQSDPPVQTYMSGAYRVNVYTSGTKEFLTESGSIYKYELPDGISIFPQPDGSALVYLPDGTPLHGGN